MISATKKYTVLNTSSHEIFRFKICLAYSSSSTGGVVRYSQIFINIYPKKKQQEYLEKIRTNVREYNPNELLEEHEMVNVSYA